MKEITPDLPLIANPALTPQQAHVQASDMLRCTLAATYEYGESLSGRSRHLMFAVLHQLEGINAMIDRSLAME